MEKIVDSTFLLTAFANALYAGAISLLTTIIRSPIQTTSRSMYSLTAWPSLLRTICIRSFRLMHGKTQRFFFGSDTRRHRKALTEIPPALRSQDNPTTI